MPKTTSVNRRVPGYKYSRTADRDLRAILQFTTSRFGRSQRQRYAELVDAAAALLGAEPMRIGSRRRDDLGRGIRSFHFELAAQRRGAAAHVLYYVQGTLDDGRDGVIILRVLHERMDPARHLSDEL